MTDITKTSVLTLTLAPKNAVAVSIREIAETMGSGQVTLEMGSLSFTGDAIQQWDALCEFTGNIAKKFSKRALSAGFILALHTSTPDADFEQLMDGARNNDTFKKRYEENGKPMSNNLVKVAASLAVAARYASAKQFAIIGTTDGAIAFAGKEVWKDLPVSRDGFKVAFTRLEEKLAAKVGSAGQTKSGPERTEASARLETAKADNKALVDANKGLTAQRDNDANIIATLKADTVRHLSAFADMRDAFLNPSLTPEMKVARFFEVLADQVQDCPEAK